MEPGRILAWSLFIVCLALVAPRVIHPDVADATPAALPAAGARAPLHAADRGRQVRVVSGPEPRKAPPWRVRRVRAPGAER
jgi:hypothetical protein